MGVSADSLDRQKEFDTTNNLGFPLLSDSERTIAKQFGTKRFGPIPFKRQTFVIDVDARVVAVIKSETDMSTHADSALDALRKLAA